MSVKVTDEYLKRFFEEKELESELFQVEHGGQLHFIESDTVINVIMEATDQEKEQIANTLRKIDFKNGNILHFLNHLAKGYVVTHF